MKKFKENNKGFSLVELIVVIAIMVVLIAVLGSTILGYVDKSKYSKDISALDSLNTAVKTFVADPSVDSSFTDQTCTLTALLAYDKGNVIKPILAEVFTIDESEVGNSKFNNSSKSFNGVTFNDVMVDIKDGAVSIYVEVKQGDYAPYVAGTKWNDQGTTLR
ncbi:MAG: type II secretion system protein [Lachnospiraceae bacterium]|nr:type II secretion system protein [Lachnospiraceae bacterium]